MPTPIVLRLVPVSTYTLCGGKYSSERLGGRNSNCEGGETRSLGSHHETRTTILGDAWPPPLPRAPVGNAGMSGRSVALSYEVGRVVVFRPSERG